MAAVLNSKDVQLSFTVLPDNFFRTYLPSGSLGFNYSIQLTQPAQLTFASYKDMNGGFASVRTLLNPDTVDYLIQKDNDHALTALYLSFLTSDSLKNCKVTGTSGFGLLGDKISSCGVAIANKPVSPPSPATSWQATVWNGSVTLTGKASTTLSDSDLRALGVTNGTASGTVSSFYVCVGYSITNNSFIDPSGCKQVFVQLYNTQANYTAHLTDGRPNGVDENGSVTTSPGGGLNNGSGLTGLINDIITAIASFVTGLVFKIYGWVVSPALVAMLSVHTYADSFVNVIYVGWQILRNVSNIVFILALIVIGLATLFRASGYEYKHLLVELILAALLVNFSLVISQSILALAETAQHQFLPNNERIINSLGEKLMPISIKQKIETSGFTDTTVFGTAGTALFIMALAIGAFGVFVAIAVFLAIRVVAIWLLLMLSPLAFAARVLPSTHHFESEWWGTFIKYAFFSPIMAFFINITAVIADNYPTVIKSIAGTSFTAGGPKLINIFIQVASNLILLVFLYAALKVAEDFGIWGASTITDIAKQGMFAPFKVGGAIAAAPLGVAVGGAKMAGGVLMQKKTQYSTPLAKKGFLGKAAFVALNPGQFKKAWVERREDRKHKIGSLAEGEASNIIHDLPFFKEETPDDREHAFLHGVDDEAKKLPYISERATFSLLEGMVKSGNKDVIARMKLWAQIKNLAEEKGMNYTLLNAKRLGMSKNFAASYDGFLEFMNEMEEKGFATEGEIGHLAPELGKIAYKNREYWYAEAQYAHGAHTILVKTQKDAKGNIVYDKLTGKPKIVGEDEWKKVMDEDEVEHETEEVVNDMRAKHTGPNPFDESTARVKARSEVIEHRMHTVDHDKFANYDAYVKGQEEIYTNYTKMAPQQKAREAHWSTEVEVYEDEHGVSKNKMSLLGIAHMATADGGDFSQGNQLQLKKRRAFQAAFKQNEGYNKRQLLNYIRDQRLQEYKDKGIQITKSVRDKIDKEAEALRDFRYAVFEKYYVDGDEFKKGTKGDMTKKFTSVDQDPEIRDAYNKIAAMGVSGTGEVLEDELLKHL